MTDPLADNLLQDFIEGDDMRVVNHYSSAEDAMSRIPNLPLPDVILMDVGLHRQRFDVRDDVETHRFDFSLRGTTRLKIQTHREMNPDCDKQL
jgi:DNA-binding NarL/FixJ family response regulator